MNCKAHFRSQNGLLPSRNAIIRSMLGLYVHVPFCAKHCHYCNFVITTASSSDAYAAFAAALAKEAGSYKNQFVGRSFDTLYLGGGTPSRLPAAVIGPLLDRVRSCFDISGDAEITLEANPSDVSSETAILWRQKGINRISLGAQSFNDRTLRALNRDHTCQDTRAAVRILRDKGFGNISLDLMLALPDESPDEAGYSLESALELRPEHISLYELTIEQGTVFGELRRKKRLNLPTEDDAVQMLLQTRRRLQEAGYLQYELLSYAKPGFESRHNGLYWRQEPYLGLGPGAFSYINGERYRLSRTVEEYHAKLAVEDWTRAESEVLSGFQKESERLLLALRFLAGVRVSDFEAVLRQKEPFINELIRDGLLENAEGRLRLTPKGSLFAETVFSKLS